MAQRIEELFDAIEATATLLDDVAETWEYRRDPDDAHYVNLAVAAEAAVIVSRDRDLLDLMDSSTPEGAAFQRRFPGLRIMDPVQFLGAYFADS